MPSVDLSIIIVSWNVWELLRACLFSIERASRPLANTSDGLRSFGEHAQANESPTLEVIVVDNASTDGTAARLPAAFPWVTLIPSSENLGFTRGNNLGYARSRGRFVYFLNPDTELLHDRVHGDSLNLLYHAVSDEDRVAVAGPQLRYADNTLQESRRRFPTPLTGFFESTWLGRLWRRNPWARRLHMADWPGAFRQDVDWLVGAALLARRDALEAVSLSGQQGPFDEGYFMYSEELDLCRRLKQQNWRIVYVPEALVIHFEGKSSDQAPAARHLHFNTSKVRYWHTWFGPRWSNHLRRYLLLEYRLQLLLERAKWLAGHKRALRTQRIAVYRQVIASRLAGEPTHTHG